MLNKPYRLKINCFQLALNIIFFSLYFQISLNVNKYYRRIYQFKSFIKHIVGNQLAESYKLQALNKN